MSLRHLPPDTTPEAVADALAADGAVIVDDLAPADQLDAVETELAPYLEVTPAGPDDFSGRNTRRTGGLIGRSPTCRELVTHPLVLGAAGTVLSHATTFQVHLTQVISIGPGEPAQPVHRDQWAFDFFEFPSGYEVQCNTIWALTDFTEANGATRVVPGSHRGPDKHRYDAADTVPAEMGRGSVVFYTGSVYHGGGANTTDSWRTGINLTYNLSWLRQEENQYLSVPHDVARELPVDLLRLMGYARGAYALGYVDDLRDPIEVLRPDLARRGFGGSAPEVAVPPA